MRPDLVLVAEGRRLVLGRRVVDVRKRPFRIGAAVLGFAAFLIAKRSVFVGVLTGEAAVMLGTYVFAP